MKFLIILIFLLIIILVTILSLNKNYNDYKQYNKIRQKISKEIYNNENKYCRVLLNNSSTGIINDSVILCNIINDLPSSPVFIFEDYNNSFPSNWFFPNLDITNFQLNIDPEKRTIPKTILCKTKQTYDILSKYFPQNIQNVSRLIYTGFTSIDRYISTSTRKDFTKFLHLAGKSYYKGTKNILKTWAENPDFPLIIVVRRNDKSVLKYNNIKNIKLITEFLSEKQVFELLNNIGIHICTSEHEGFGHYLNESLSVGAVTLFTNAPCMNEKFIDMHNGIGVDAKFDGYYNTICPKYITTIDSIKKSVNKTLSLTFDELMKISKNARQSFIENDNNFKNKIKDLVRGSNKVPFIIHYMWISKKDPFVNVEIPEKNNKYIKTWKENNKNFKFMYWSGKDILDFVTNYFPEYLSLYTSFKKVISMCDFARFLIVYVYGGIYMDIDFFCKKNLEYLLECDSLFILEPIKKHNETGKSLFNGFFISYPYNIFILDWIKNMAKHKN